MRWWLLLIVVAACGGDDDAEPVFPADWAATYVEVRGCRASSDHDLNKIRVVADPAASAPYLARDQPFPVGAIVLKPEYDFADGACAGPITQWTVMRREAPGGAPELMDWTWQRVDLDRNVVSENDERCTACHASCGSPPDGYLGTCTVP
jgi:hypothetical protein